MKRGVLLTLILFITLIPPRHAFAQDDTGTDAYDPFADYSEFDQASEEEADINFFRNGRFFALGFLGGYRTFTSVLGDLYDPGATFGAYITYFFDLRFAIQLTYLTGDHNFHLNLSNASINGNVSVQEVGFGIKYFLNTQNVTKGLASINPYLLLSVEQVSRVQRFDGTFAVSNDATMGFAGTFGVEFPMLRNKMYFGAEATYVYVGFPDENNRLVIGSTPTDIYPRGDLARFSGFIGINF